MYFNPNVYSKHSNYKNVYNQNINTSSYTSNSKFLQPQSNVYYQRCNKMSINKQEIPSYFKYVPENLKINPEIQGNTYREDYRPPKCDMCRKGGNSLPGAGYYGMQGSKQIGNDIKKNPSICNYQNETKENFVCQDNPKKKLVFSRNMVSFAPPSKWGSKAWDFFHSVSFSYPENPTSDQKQSAMDFFKALPFMLPCSTCGNHCQKQLEKFPPRVENREQLTKWLYNFHNMVNQRLGKKMPSFEEISLKYK